MAIDKNYGLYLDGNTQVDVGTGVDLKLTKASFTVEVEIKVDRYNSTNIFLDSTILGSKKANGHVSSVLHLTLRNKIPYMGFLHNDTRAKQVINEGIWYHLAFVYDINTKTQQIYVNGKLDGQAVAKNPYVGSDPLALGNWGSRNAFFQGQIRCLKFWNSALPASKILDNINSDLKKNDPGLTAYWTFEDGLVNRFKDSQNNNAQLAQIAALNVQIHTLNAVQKALQLKIDDLNKGMEEKEELEGLLKEKDAEINRLNEKIEREANDNTGVPIASLIDDANKQISKARSLLKDSDYHLGHVNLQFKMIPSETGNSLIFPSPAEVVSSSDALSTIDLEFSPKDATKVAEKTTKEVPDLKGLTEIMARRKIAQAGFLTEIKYQAIKDQKDKDRVTKQIPDPNKQPQAELNSSIIIFIGKEIM